jgi:porphobilinogen deaminase
LKLRIATRGSKLSLIQAQQVAKIINEKLGFESELIIVKTKGDIMTDSPISSIGKGVFSAEVNEAVVKGKADLAVHSMKDIMTELPYPLDIAITLPRGNPFDAFVSSKYNFNEIPTGAKIGTSSYRRQLMMKYVRKDVNMVLLRGNVDTRLKKIEKDEVDGAIMAMAGLERLGIVKGYKIQQLDPLMFTPSPNQGIIVAIARKDGNFYNDLKGISDINTEVEAKAERDVVKVIGGGCGEPLGVLFKREKGKLKGIATYITKDMRRVTVTDEYDHNDNYAGKKLAIKLVDELKNVKSFSF